MGILVSTCVLLSTTTMTVLVDDYPSYLDPTLCHSLSPAISRPPITPISPASFYGMASSDSLRPPLRSLPQGVSSGASSADPLRPPTPNLGVEKPKNFRKGRKHKEFTATNLDNLLHMTIKVNPFSAPQNLIGEAWKEVTQKSQAAGFCLGCNVDTCKNCVMSLLAWCEVSIPALSL